MQHYWFADLPEQRWDGHLSDIKEMYDDNYTESYRAFYDLSLNIEKPTVWVDVGGGFSDDTTFYMEERFSPWLLFYVVDPYNRSYKHNKLVQEFIEKNRGADYVSSMSVLNILESDILIMNHLNLLYRILKPGGKAFIKVWNGNRKDYKEPIPDGPIIDRHRMIFQRQRPIYFFESYIRAVFDHCEVRDAICIIADKRDNSI